MLEESVEILRSGRENGDDMLIRIPLQSGIQIYGLPTENHYGGGWDLGPTWNYLVLADKPFLIDAGRKGMGNRLFQMMETVGFGNGDLSFLLLTHGHEDHDGAIAEMVGDVGLPVKAHDVYDKLIRFYPDEAPSPSRKNFPASCWRCFMPESFSREHCLDYHQERSCVPVDAITEDPFSLQDGVAVHHLPGHSPDSLGILIGDEALIIGDTVLPDITPWPSQEGFFEGVRGILGPGYPSADRIYGLRAYVRTLKRLEALGEKMGHLLVLPAHRLFYGGEWKEVDLKKRARELIDHHIQRCDAILAILRAEPKTTVEIARGHFEERLLKGYGILMAENEIVSHCELMIAAGDITPRADGKMEATGTQAFETMIYELKG